jgi:hypothetical protein
MGGWHLADVRSSGTYRLVPQPLLAIASRAETTLPRTLGHDPLERSAITDVAQKTMAVPATISWGSLWDASF